MHQDLNYLVASVSSGRRPYLAFILPVFLNTGIFSSRLTSDSEQSGGNTKRKYISPTRGQSFNSRELIADVTEVPMCVSRIVVNPIRVKLRLRFRLMLYDLAFLFAKRASELDLLFSAAFLELQK